MNEYQGTELTGVIDTDPSQQEYLQQLDLDTIFYSSLAEYIENHPSAGDTDVINICVPNGLHASLAIHALENNYHVVIEKPMALNRRECEGIIEAALQSSKKVFVVKQNRYSPPSKWLKQVVSKGYSWGYLPGGDQLPLEPR
ncbi:MAG: Gfo/Idh/MocA family oxidoreductase [Balneolaceae bacterium]|nr:Gfo/Idh/MocA family oxidoreductase [Balneolaceae bacterium]